MNKQAWWLSFLVGIILGVSALALIVDELSPGSQPEVVLTHDDDLLLLAAASTRGNA